MRQPKTERLSTQLLAKGKTSSSKHLQSLLQVARSKERFDRQTQGLIQQLIPQDLHSKIAYLTHDSNELTLVSASAALKARIMMFKQALLDSFNEMTGLQVTSLTIKIRANLPQHTGKATPSTASSHVPETSVKGTDRGANRQATESEEERLEALLKNMAARG